MRSITSLLKKKFLPKEFEPKFISVFRKGYKKKHLRGDISAALTVSIVALPLAVALAVASGASPEEGVYTVILGGFLVAFLGGSKTQIAGPTAAFVVIVCDIIQKFGMEGLILSTFIAGILLILAGLSRLGSIVRYVPYSVITGFSTGLGVTLFTAQLKDFFGLTLQTKTASFVDLITAYVQNIQTLDKMTTAFGLGAVILILGIRKRWPKIPVLLFTLALASYFVWQFNFDVETIGSRFGALSNHLPTPKVPVFSWQLFMDVFPSSCVIAFLAGIESLLCAVIADGMTGDNHRPNIELIAQGAANVVTPLFGGLPVTAAFARTATNIKAGAKTPLAGVLQALLVFFFMIFFSSLFELIPLTALAAILLIVGLDMCDFHKFKRMMSAPLGDRIVLITTFALTVVFDISVAIQVGIILSALIFMRRMSLLTNITPVDGGSVCEREEEREESVVPEGVRIYHINGPFFFGAASRLRVVLEKASYIPKVYILNLSNMPMIDITGAQILNHFIERCHKQGSKVILSGVADYPREVLLKNGIHSVLPKKCLTADLNHAIELSKGLI
ncbi:MAG TPA: SulP family inorganic anion transporter [Alphaproteobacteria bacterium]|nr:SulP family inorganic anion transporter [Alphaproteobacteria bacterium]